MSRFIATLESGLSIPEAPKRVLVPVDFSAESAAALRYAIARSPSGTVDVVHVWDLPSYTGGGMVDATTTGGDPGAPQLASQYVLDRATERMAELLAPHRDNARITGAVLNGDVGKVLVELSEKYDLVVIGRRPHEGMRELFLGSAAGLLLADARCPVVTVHELEGQGAHGGHESAAE